ncbi:MAG: acyl-ACP--UDP-N-acetylglucosamine O-acyltransferase [Parvibaculales bacterium]
MTIHPTAIIEAGAELGDNVSVGPYSIIGHDVVLADDVVVESHVVVTGRTSIGARTHIFPFASIGHVPQDLKFDGENTRLEIGSDNRIREYVTMNPGTEGGGGVTKVGDNCLFMASAHVAHDCMVGDHVILANNATLAGHVEVGDFAIFGGLAAIHQFCRVGAHAFLGGGSIVVEDVIPYGSVTGNRAVLAGLNLVGLKRRGFDRQHIHALRSVYKSLFENHNGAPLTDRLDGLDAQCKDNPLVTELVSFIKSGSGRGFCQPKA